MAVVVVDDAQDAVPYKLHRKAFGTRDYLAIGLSARRPDILDPQEAKSRGPRVRKTLDDDDDVVVVAVVVAYVLPVFATHRDRAAGGSGACVHVLTPDALA